MQHCGTNTFSAASGEACCQCRLPWRFCSDTTPHPSDSSGTIPSSVSFLEVDTGHDGESVPQLWTTNVEEPLDPSEWPSVAREHQAALEWLGALVSSLFVTVPVVVDKQNSMYRPIVTKHS